MKTQRTRSGSPLHSARRPEALSLAQARAQITDVWRRRGSWPSGDFQGDLLTALVKEPQAYRSQYATVIDGYRVTTAYVERHRVFAAVDDTGRLVGSTH